MLAGPSSTLVVHRLGRAIPGTQAQGAALSDAVRAALELQQSRDERTQPSERFVVGALPFAPAAPARLYTPSVAERASAWSVPSCAPVTTRRSVAPTPSDARGARFMGAVREALDDIRAGRLEKVVLSRFKDVPLGAAPALWPLLAQLRSQNPQGFTYCLAAPDPPGYPAAARSRHLVGASPELLLSRRGDRIVSMPLAGSSVRALDPSDDDERARQLLGSHKDRHEHRLVVEQILDTLAPHVLDLSSPVEPSVIRTPNMLHLGTRIEARVLPSGLSAFELALLLHPTPAVCGLPISSARGFIEQAEGWDRGLFTGTLGWVNERGEGDWIVTIRCAEIGEDSARLFAGAGIVEGSVPELELAETEAKMLAMLRALESAQSGSCPEAVGVRAPSSYPPSSPRLSSVGGGPR